MAADLNALRAAAAREERELVRANVAVDAALRTGEAAREAGAGTAELRRAETKLRTATDKLVRVPDRIRDLLTQATPDEVLGALERDVPLVLLPVRLETRVLRRTGGWDLGVRFFPDAIHVDAHEPGLTEAERDAGAAFWARPAAERDVGWAELVALLGAQRAAWVSEATRNGPPAAAAAAARFTRPSWTQVLPDRFLIAVTADGAELPLVEGRRVRAPLPTGPDPRLSPDADDGTDAGMRWMTDFTAAVDQGMGVRVPLGAQPPKRIDQVLALGVRASVAPADTATLLGGLVDAHRYAGGLEVLRVGTPTNAGADGTPQGARPPAEATPAPGGRTISAGADGARLARALGIDPNRFAGVAGTDATSEADAQAMLTALWPGTIGYFLRQMLAASVTDAEATLLRAHAVNWVRGRGPLAPLRVGRTPYGVLPATSLAGYAPDPGDPPEAARLVALLRALLPAWEEAAAKVPKAGRGKPQDAAATLAQILGLAPVSVAIDARRVYPQGVVDLLTGLAGMSSDEQDAVRTIGGQLIRDGMKSIGALKDGDDLHKIIGSATARRVTIPRVQVAPVSPTAPLVDDYLTFLRSATVEQLAAAEEHYDSPLLYLLARYALLQQYARAATGTVGTPARDPRDILDRHVVIDIAGVDKPQLALDVLAGPGGTRPPGGGGPPPPVSQVIRQDATRLAGHVEMGGGFEDPLLGTGGAAAPRTGRAFAVGEAVGGGGATTLRTTATRGQARAMRRAANPGTAETAQVLSALAHLAPLPSATLDRLLRETLDLASHRFDAWVTSLATKRLSRMRAAKPAGAHLGAYGVVRDLVPAPAATSVKPPGSPAGTANAEQTVNQGFLHAPSLGHAATAAVLRSAHAAHGDGTAFAVTLESARVRLALELLDGVRQGQPLAALLGYRLERELLERGRASAIAKLRDVAPLRTSDIAPPAGASFEAIAPRDVVDGLRLARGEVALPATLSGPEKTAVDAALAIVRDALDATGDLLLAEGVHQIVAGTPARAAAAAQAAAGTGPPPDPLDVIATPRSGTGMTHRVLLASDVSSEGWVATRDRTPRVLADPLLEGWVAALLGDASAHGALVTYTYADEKGAPQTAQLEIKVEDLGIGALDAVAMSAPPAHGQRCELERRVLDRALSPGIRPRDVPADALAQPASRADHLTASSRTPLVDLVVVAAAIGELLAVARTPAPHELEPGLTVDADGLDAGELSKRLSAILGVGRPAAARLGDLLDGVADEDVDLARLLEALRAASLLVSAALPEVADPARDDARERLVTQGRGIATELSRRIEAADELIRARSLGTGNAGSVAQRREVARVLLDGAPPMAPLLDPDLAQAVGKRLASPPSMGAGATSAAERTSVVRGFLARARHARRGVARLDRAEALGVALGGRAVTLRVAQSGGDPAAPWAALPQPGIQGGITSLVVAGDAAFDATAPVAVLALDDWTEVVPRDQEVTALAVHTDRPGNDAPQIVLVAVPPDPAQAWSVAGLRTVVEETVELASLRMVDPPALGRFGHLLPALLLACTGRQGQLKVPEKGFFPRLAP